MMRGKIKYKKKEERKKNIRSHLKCLIVGPVSAVRPSSATVRQKKKGRAVEII
jgi:hypothetical protein